MNARVKFKLQAVAAALLVLLALMLVILAFLYAANALPGTVASKAIVRVDGEPIARWYIDVQHLAILRQPVEIGPALYNCFEVGDSYIDGSVGRCEGVVWP